MGTDLLDAPVLAPPLPPAFAPTLHARGVMPSTADRAVARRTVALPGGRTIAYAEAGAGPDLVLIHGTLMTLEDMWLGPMPALARDHRCIALDRPGHGLSVRRRLRDASPWRQAALIHEALQALGVARPILVGHSFGGTVALCHALRYPEATAGVIALAPLCFPELRLEQVLFGPRAVPGLGDGLAEALSVGADPAVLPLAWRAIFLPQTMPDAFGTGFPFALATGPARMIAEGEDAASIMPALTRAALAYPTMRVPVRILGGTADLVVNNAIHGLTAAALMPGARYAWVPGAGHMLHHFFHDAVGAAVQAVA